MKDGKQKIASNIVLLGFVSFFADISSEMVYPLIPLYLTAVLGATPALIGIIEGVAESLASLLKVFSGFLCDTWQRKKPLAFWGYASGLVYKAALLLAGSWAGILAARVIDRFGKGIRTAPRDVMIADSAAAGHMGQAYGVHKALDMAGSAIGILLAWILLRRIGNQAYQTVFALSILPVVFALALFFLIREKRTARQAKPREHFWENMKLLDGNLKLYLAVVFVFSLGNSSNTFLLLKAYAIGFASTDVIALYFLCNVVTALFALPLGKRSDRIGRKQLLIGGYVLFAVVYAGFAFAQSKGVLIAAFAVYGLYTAMISGVERAYIAEIAPAHLKGTMLGLHATLVGVALLPASVIAGGLWTLFGSAAPFCWGGGLALLAALLLGFRFHPDQPKA